MKLIQWNYLYQALATHLIPADLIVHLCLFMAFVVKRKNIEYSHAFIK